MKSLHLYDFGIFIELLPDEEERQMLENNIQLAISQKMIDLDDAIDIRETKNVKLANQLLKLKRRKKMERDQQMAQQNMQAQSQQAQATAQEAAKMEIEKNNAKVEAEESLEQIRNRLKIQYLQQEARVKKELMMLEFELNTKLKAEEREVSSNLDAMKEDRKDERVDRQAKHQSKMIEQRKQGDTVKSFESSGNDILTGGADSDRVTP